VFDAGGVLAPLAAAVDRFGPLVSPVAETEVEVPRALRLVIPVVSFRRFGYVVKINGRVMPTRSKQILFSLPRRN